MTTHNPVVDVILARIDNGKLPPDKTEARLQEIIDEEISRTDRPADTELIDGCLELLEQLHQLGESLPERRTPILRTVGKWVVVAAAVVLLVLGLTDKLRIRLFEHSNSVDGEQHIIIGHEVRVDMIEKAIADHSEQSSYSFTGVQEMEQELGFNPGITPELADGWKLAGINGDFLPDTILITAMYYTDDNSQDFITLSIQCFTDMSKAGTIIEPSEIGTILRINGVDVYLSHDMERQAAQWTRGSTVFLLAGRTSHADLLLHVQHLLESFISPTDALAAVSTEQIRNSIALNLFHNEYLETNDFGALCDFLGFTPALFSAESLGASSVTFSVSTTPAFIRVTTCYWDAEDTPLANFTNMYYGSTEDMYFAFEEVEEGHFVRVNGRQVYTSHNVNWQNYNWNQETTISVLYSAMDEGRILSLLSDFFAGNVMTREAPLKPIADVTPDQIGACISKALARNEQLETTDFNVVCDYLGFTPAIFPAELIGADRVHFIISPTPAFITVDSIYQDADGATLANFSNVYYLNEEDMYYTFEQSEEGRFVHIEGQQVYTSQNFDVRNYCWAQGTIISVVYSKLDEDVILNALTDFFSGSVMPHETQTAPIADVTPDQISDCINRNLNRTEWLQTTDFDAVCKVLGFTPALFPKEAIGAAELSFNLAIGPDLVRLDAFYNDGDGSTLVNFVNLYSPNPDDMYFSFEQDEIGQFINVSGHQIYTSHNYETVNYNWTQDATVSVVYSTLEDTLMRNVLADFFAGNVLSREAQRVPVADVTPEMIASIIMKNEDTKLTTRSFQEVCDLLGFVPRAFRPEVFGTVNPLYDVTLQPGRILFCVLYEAEDQNNNVLFYIDYYENMNDLYVSFEQSKVGTFCDLEGKSVYISPNLYRTNYCWVEGSAVYELTGVLPEETTLPLLEAFLAGDVYMP